MNSTNSPLSMIDLFAGCGGLSLGMEQAGFLPVFVSELNSDAMASYLANRNHLINNRPFSSHAELRCHDADELQGNRLEKLVEDLSRIAEFDLKFDADCGSTLDLIAGGPPCQGYSGLGHRRSYAVDKEQLPSNRLYVRMAQVIRRLRPRIFLFENVRGLLTSRWTRDGDRRIWPDVVAEFRAIPGYSVRWSLVHAKNYGVPQNRPRILLVGIRDDVAARNPLIHPEEDSEDAVKCGFLPIGDPRNCPDLVDVLGDLVDPEIGRNLLAKELPNGSFVTTNYPNEPMTELQKSLRASQSPGHSARLTEQEYSKHAPRIIEKFTHMLQNAGEIPEWAKTRKFSQRLLPKRWGHKGPSITATSMPDDYIHFSQPRTLTVREWARLQLFPDWYEFVGKRTTGGLRRAGNPLEGNFDREAPKFTQIGNAVPVALARSVGDHFRQILLSEDKQADFPEVRPHHAQNAK